MKIGLKNMCAFVTREFDIFRGAPIVGRSGWLHRREGRIGLQCRRYDLKKDIMIIMTVAMTKMTHV